MAEVAGAAGGLAVGRTADQVGVHQVVLRVQDGKGGVALQNFAIEVAAPNTAPIVSSTRQVLAAP